MGLIVGFSLDQFSEVLKIRDATGKPYLLIGGQAVNYWASRYLSSEPDLEKLKPFTSADIDFKGGADDVRRIAAQLNLKAGFPPKVAMTSLAGVIPFRIQGEPANIEVVRQVVGTSSNVDALALEAKWEDKTIRVLDPVSLLASKLELAATVSQTGRNDGLHLKILFYCVRAFLADLLQRVEVKEVPARNWLLAANQVLKLTTNRRAQKLGEKYSIDWSGILPGEAIAKSPDEKVKKFYDQQMNRTRPST